MAEKSRIQFHNESKEFGDGFHAAKLWYFLKDGKSEKLFQDRNKQIGYPDGVSIRPMKSNSFVPQVC